MLFSEIFDFGRIVQINCWIYGYFDEVFVVFSHSSCRSVGGGNKLYISSHSAVESQAFYKSMGCTEAKMYNKAHTEKEPFDVQLECVLR